MLMHLHLLLWLTYDLKREMLKKTLVFARFSFDTLFNTEPYSLGTVLYGGRTEFIYEY